MEDFRDLEHRLLKIGKAGINLVIHLLEEFESLSGVCLVGALAVKFFGPGDRLNLLFDAGSCGVDLVEGASD